MSEELSKADIIEALLFASDQPLTTGKLAEIAALPPREVLAELEVLREEKMRIGSLQIVEVSGGWQLVSKPEFAPFIARLRAVPRQRLSRAAFEVLAVVAYRQPVTRAEIEELRGVDCTRPLTFLLEKRLLALGGRKEAPGRPWLYKTTPQFLEHFGLRALDDLPPLAELAELNESTLQAMSRDLFRRQPMQEVIGDADIALIPVPSPNIGRGVPSAARRGEGTSAVAREEHQEDTEVVA